jgi:hypothetical protein
MTRKGDLKRFETNVWSHLQDKGLDTIAYLPDAVDKTRVSSVVTEYTRFSVDSATKQALLIVNKYDEYDKANDHEACEFLLNSLDPTLADDLRMDRRDGDNFPVMYLRMIRLIRSTSIDHFDTLKTTIQKVKASQFPGQDLNAMARKIQVAKELETAGQYDPNLSLATLDSFMEAGGGSGPDPETYRFLLRSKRGQLEAKLLEIAYMDPSVAHAEIYLAFYFRSGQELLRSRLLDKSYNAALKTSVIQLTRILVVDRDLSSRHAVALIYIVDRVDDVISTG